jgi:hypothetical protein
LFTKMYCKPTHAGCYLHLKSNYPHMWKGESFIVWSVLPRSYVRFRRISTWKFIT